MGQNIVGKAKLSGEAEALLTMVGTEGLADLEALVRLVPKHHGFASPYSLAIHFIHLGIEQTKENFQKQIGITSYNQTVEKEKQ
jgi:hypothetical protein